MLNFLPHAIWWKDRAGTFLGCNTSFFSYLGIDSVEQMIGKTDHDFWPEEQAEFFRRCDATVMETGEPMLDVEEPAWSRQQGLRTLLTSKVPLRDEDGRIIGVFGICADITERKRMEQALEGATYAAESAARAKSNFLTVVSHELRTPLTLILGPLELLLSSEGENLRPATRTELERIRRNATRLHLLVNSILDVAKAEAGAHGVDWEPLDVAELGRGIVGDATAAAAARGIALSFVERVPVGVVTLDRSKLEKILLNLLGNALKFTPPGGTVVVELTSLPAPAASLGDQGFELSVTDTGIGIADHDQAHLFERFHQIDSSAQRKYEGTGLGLRSSRRSPSSWAQPSASRAIPARARGSAFVSDRPDRRPGRS